MIYLIAGLGVSILLGLLSFYLVKYGEKKEETETLKKTLEEFKRVNKETIETAKDISDLSDDDLDDFLRKQ